MTRIKGQDVVVQMNVGGAIAGYLTQDVRNFELTPKVEKLEEQYLGQFSKRYDEIFHGVDFKFDIHVESSNVLKFMELLQSRGKGGSQNVKINITATLRFSDRSKTITLNDCFFEDVPFSFGGRSEYGQITISGSCTDFTPVP